MQKKVKNRIKYKVGDVILLRRSAYTNELGSAISKLLDKPVIMVDEFLDFRSISKQEAIRALKYIINVKTTG